MTKYSIGVEYKMYGYLTIEAESEEEALKIANDPKWNLDDLEGADYLSDSWVADPDSVDIENDDD